MLSLGHERSPKSTGLMATVLCESRPFLVEPMLTQHHSFCYCTRSHLRRGPFGELGHGQIWFDIVRYGIGIEYSSLYDVVGYCNIMNIIF